MGLSGAVKRGNFWHDQASGLCLQKYDALPYKAAAYFASRFYKAGTAGEGLRVRAAGKISRGCGAALDVFQILPG